MRNLNLENVEEVQEYKKVVAGAYICKITSVQDLTQKEYLKVEYDIANGEFKNYYSKLMESKNFWGASLIKSYKESALPFFKGFITAIENSNKGFKFEYDEASLVGKYVGLVLGEEEYNKQDGTIATRLYVHQVRSVAEVQKGNIEIPEIKLLNKSNNNPDIALIDNEDIPW